MSFYADPYNVMDIPNEYPLHFATRKGQFESVRKLLKDRFDPNRHNVYGLTPLHLACQHNYPAIARLLLAHGGDKWKQEPCGPTPFQTAIYKGNLEIIRLLLEDEHIDVRDHGYTALHWATKAIRPLIVAWLLQHKADPNSRVGNTGKTPIHLLRGTLAFNEPRSVEAVLNLLCKYGADLSAVDAEGKMAIHSPHNNPDFVKKLITMGVNVNAVDSEGKTALYYACGINADIYHVRWLLEQGARTDLSDTDGITPLVLAVSHGEDQVAALLVQHGADVRCCDNQGKTPLHALLESRVRDKDAKVEFLLKCMFSPWRGDIDAKTKAGWTALHYAVYYNCFPALKLLLANGADINLQTALDQTPLHLVGLKNYDIPEGKEQESIQEALNLKILRRTQKVSRLPWERLLPETSKVAPQYKDEDEQDVDDNSVASFHGLPWKVRSRAIYRLLLKRGADCTALDNQGNLPFFLAAATGWLDATFHMLRTAAKQGMFESKNLSKVSKNRSTYQNETFSTKKQRTR